jgi:hypothetical protein
VRKGCTERHSDLFPKLATGLTIFWRGSRSDPGIVISRVVVPKSARPSAAWIVGAGIRSVAVQVHLCARCAGPCWVHRPRSGHRGRRVVQLAVVPRDQHLAATMITTISTAARIASGLHASARSLLLPCSTSNAGSGARGAVQRSMQGASIAGAELRELGAVDVELGDQSCWRRASVAGVELFGGAAAHQRRMRVRIPPATTTTVLCSGRISLQKPRGIAQVRVTQVVGSC